MLYFFFYDVKVQKVVKTVQLTVTMFSAEVSLPFCIIHCYLVYSTFVLGRVISVLCRPRKFHGQEDLENPGLYLKCVAARPRSSVQDWLNGVLLVVSLSCFF
jgi:hypothetical protein